ncbi:hypothetical protein MLD38_038856 [Melastoma candidum]|uniref:Uncharacterized protein n=1 Tax=Melastoma candidum TaxID=119954 RepID=A0ACB9L194_9MYRT|nr:hypothetical protein MLD38_038856 [Melastoma candidum]
MEGRDGSRPSDLPQEWPPDPKVETSIDEAMWQLQLGEDYDRQVYPERPDEADCIYYLRTGFCGYGPRCRFNHPRERGPVLGASRAGSAEFPERNGQPVCQFYMRTGTCKFGPSCKYHHPRQDMTPNNPVQLNYYGYPYRPEEKECSYYMKTSRCKFGDTCKFHHPQPAGVPVAAPSPPPFQLSPMPLSVATPSPYPMVQSPPIPSSQQYGVLVARPPVIPSYVQSPYGPVLLSSGMVPLTGYSPYQASVSPVASSSPQPNSGSNSVYGMAQISSTVPAFAGPYLTSPFGVDPSSLQKEHLFPERPGQPDCQYYLKTGDCRYGSSCRYHHPPEANAAANVILNPLGLPLRPGVTPCMHFARGECKFGPACKFDHSVGALSYSSFVSSLGDAPVIPYPAGLPYMSTPDASLGQMFPSMVSAAPYSTSQKPNQDAAASLGTHNSSDISSKEGSA